MPTAPIDWEHTVAYTSVISTGEGVSLNLVGREPNGTVEREDYERVRDEVAAALLELTDPETGAHPIGGVFRKEDVLSGPYLDRAPDCFSSRRRSTASRMRVNWWRLRTGSLATTARRASTHWSARA